MPIAVQCEHWAARNCRCEARRGMAEPSPALFACWTLKGNFLIPVYTRVFPHIVFDVQPSDNSHTSLMDLFSCVRTTMAFPGLLGLQRNQPKPHADLFSGVMVKTTFDLVTS